MLGVLVDRHEPADHSFLRGGLLWKIGAPFARRYALKESKCVDPKYLRVDPRFRLFMGFVNRLFGSGSK